MKSDSNQLNPSQQQAMQLLLKQRIAELAQPTANIVLSSEAFLTATKQMPLGHIEFWESFIRNEYLRIMPSQAYPFYWKTNEKAVPWVVGLCHSCGFVRELKLNELALAKYALTPFILALVFRRLNDWVGEVRAAAYNALKAAMQHMAPDDVAIALLFTLKHWSSWRRMGKNTQLKVLQLISEPALLVSIKTELIRSPSGPVCRLLVELSKFEYLDQYLEQIATSAAQPCVRARAYRMLLENQASWVVAQNWVWTDKIYGKGRFEPVHQTRQLSISTIRESILNRAAQDKSALVRNVVIEHIIINLDQLNTVGPLADQMRLVTKQLTNDKSIAVANRAAFALKHLSPNDLS